MMLRSICLAVLAMSSSAKLLKLEVPMRDGFNLSTWVNCPFEFGNKEKTVIFEASPYGHEHLETIAETISDILGTEYCSVRQDMRGSGDSEGMDFTLWRSQPNDTSDTFEWIVKQDWSNGEIFQTGASADGLAAFTGTLSRPVGLEKQFVIWAAVDTHAFSFPGGAYRKSLQDGWLSGSFPKQYPALRQESREHEAPSSWWDPVNVTQHCDWETRPTVLLAGWYDIFLNGNLAAYDCYTQNNTNPVYLLVEACGHCLGAPRCPFYEVLDVESIPIAVMMAVEIFEGREIPKEIEKVTFRVLGAGDAQGNFIDPLAPGNYWSSLPAWPQFTADAWLLNANGALARIAQPGAAARSYSFDPTNPVSTIGGNNLCIDCGALDQRTVENRSDVLLFTSPELSEPYAITGPLDAVLYVSSNRNDTDFTVKLTDVYPDGRSILINDGILRMRWRAGVKGGYEPTPMTPGTVYEITVSLWNASYIFAKGHKIRVAVSSSNAPRFEPNPNNGLPLTTNGTVYTANNTLHTSGQYPSRMILPYVTADQIPKTDLVPIVDKWLATKPARYSALIKKIADGQKTRASDIYNSVQEYLKSGSL
ncbi:Cocaine esterase [Diplonema papillatum]|nr:Cocaine esterase [Diplonema papillatum]